MFTFFTKNCNLFSTAHLTIHLKICKKRHIILQKCCHRQAFSVSLSCMYPLQRKQSHDALQHTLVEKNPLLQIKQECYLNKWQYLCALYRDVTITGLTKNHDNISHG